MISEQAIKASCSQQTFARAELLARSRASFRSAVVSVTDTRGVRITEVSAGVRSSDKRRHYKTSVMFDEGVGEIVDYSCNCPAASEYLGMCKHEAALLLFYNQNPQAFMGFATKKHARQSTNDLFALMDRESTRTGETETSGIDLIPSLRYYFGNWDLSFKIAGAQGSYVLKSIDDFLARMSKGEFYSYGKKLSFTHKPERLTPRGLALYRFIDAACEQRKLLARASNLPYSMDYGFGNAQGHTVHTARELTLTDAEVVELFDILEPYGVSIYNDELSQRAFDAWTTYAKTYDNVVDAQVVQGDPDLHIEIRETEDGFGITPPDPAVIIAAKGRMYLWQGRFIYRCSAELERMHDILSALYENEGLFIAKEDAARFCATLLPLMQAALDLEIPAGLAALKPLPCKLDFYFDATRKAISCQAYATYGDEKFPLDVVGNAEAAGAGKGAAPGAPSAQSARASKIVRDAETEAQATRLLQTLVPAGQIDIHDGDAVGALLFGGLAAFKEAGEVFTTRAFDKLIFDKQPSVQTGLSIAGNLINLNISSDELPADEVARLLASYRSRKHYHRLKNGAFVNIEDMDKAQLARIVHALDDLDLKTKDIAEGPIELPAYEAFYLDAQLDNANSDGSIRRYIENFEAAKAKPHTPPQTLAKTLRSYQVEGFSWLSLLADCGFGGILADEMGLGKSIQMISFLLSRADEARATGPSLLVCPASLLYNWMAEFAKFAPKLRVATVDGSRTERRATRATAGELDVLIASYDIVRIDAAEFAEQSYFACILDEAQFIKNRSTKAAKAVKKIEAKHRFALTGTPIENRPSELWSIFDFLMPGLLGSPMRFRENFEIPILGGDAEATARLRALVGPFILRRTKKEVLSDLPDKIESVVYTKLEGEQRRLYDANEQNLRDRLNVQKKRSAANGSRRNAPISAAASAKRASKLRAKRPVIRDVATDVVEPDDMSKVEVLAEITRLRQICLDPGLVYDGYAAQAAKLPVIVDLVQQGIDSGLKMLVFSQFTSFLSEIENQLDAAGIAHYKLTGQTPAKKRLEMVDAFNADDTPVFLISMKAGGTGLNLTGASLVILADPWWNAAVQEQASDRAHRIGQTRDVNVVKVVAKDTIEERIVALQETKRELAASLVGNQSEATLANLTADDLIDLLS